MQEHEGWLKIADEDFLLAKLAIKNELFSSVAYHCQQAAEKYLKGYLVFNKKKVIKTHDLTKLVVLCNYIDNDFSKLYVSSEKLNPFSTKFRYPTEFDIPDLETAKAAISNAKKIMNFVLKKISAPETGQTNIFIGER